MKHPRVGAGSGIDWQASSNAGWSTTHSPYSAAKAAKAAGGNFSDYLVKLFLGK